MRKNPMGKIISAVKKNLAEILVILASLLLLCGFVAAKEGFHMDEMLSFELSNAEYNPWIVPTQPEGRLAKFMHNEIDGASVGETFSNLVREIKDVLQNRGSSKLLSYKADVYEEPVWITAQQFRDYITVGERDGFNLLSVYFNVKDDNHPPVHFMLLHLISSVFRGNATVWMGCLLNLAAIMFTLLLLMKIGGRLAEVFGMPQRARMLGLCCALVYGVSAGAVSTTLLIRMYGLVTLWCVAFFWIVLEKWLDKSFDKGNRKLIAVTVLGFLTQYFFLFYCIPLAFMTSVSLVKGKRMKEFWRFVRSMVIAAVLGIALFPFAISDVLHSGRGVEALGNLTQGFEGYGARLAAFLAILEKETLSVEFWLMLMILSAVAWGLRKKTKKQTGRKLSKSGMLMLLLPAFCYFLLAARMSPYLVDRYVMPVFPFVIVAGVSFMAMVVNALECYGTKRLYRGLAATVCAVTLVFQAGALLQLWNDGSYLYRGYEKQETLAKENGGRACICVYAGVGYYENLKEFTHYDKTLLVTPEELRNRKDTKSIADEENLVVLIKYGVDYSEILEILTRDYGFELENGEWLLEGPYEDTICLMRKES